MNFWEFANNHALIALIMVVSVVAIPSITIVDLAVEWRKKK